MVLLELGMLLQPGMVLLQQPGMFGSSFHLEFPANPSAWNIATPLVVTVNKLNYFVLVILYICVMMTILNQHVEKTNSPRLLVTVLYIFVDSEG
jgi:hypothetical protein